MKLIYTYLISRVNFFYYPDVVRTFKNISVPTFYRHEFYPGIGDGIAKCPFDPEDNSTAVWVRTGNPGDHPAIYSGTNAEFTKADAVIFRYVCFFTIFTFMVSYLICLPTRCTLIYIKSVKFSYI